eukprot:s420_g6.t1
MSKTCSLFDKVSEFLQSHGLTPDWSIRTDQPMHLSIMAALSTIMDDNDRTLFPMLLHGAPTGFDNNIPPSGCFPAAEDKTDETIPLSILTTNWQSAESVPTTRDLVNQELDKGWIYKYEGSIEDAQREFGDKLALGRLGLALSDHRPPRLVVDSSICGVNSRCSIPERTTLPRMELTESSPQVLNDIRVGSIDEFGLHLSHILEHCEQVVVSFSWGCDPLVSKPMVRCGWRQLWRAAQKASVTYTAFRPLKASHGRLAPSGWEGRSETSETGGKQVAPVGSFHPVVFIFVIHDTALTWSQMPHQNFEPPR